MFSVFLLMSLVLRHELSFASSCETLDSVKSIVECALENAPETIRARASTAQAQELESVARQRPNPELSGSSTYGELLGDSMATTSIDLTHTFEIGGKRSARIEKAQGEFASANASFLRAKETTVIETLGHLYRLRQIAAERAILEEALRTFRKIQKQYSSRPNLGPEQQVSFSIFQLAEGDYKFRRNQLEIETTQLLQNLSVAVGKAFSPSDTALPPPKPAWPEVADISDPLTLQGSAMQLPRADMLTAQGELSLAQSESWPNLKVGPTYQSQTQGPITGHSFGINFSFPIPVLNINGGGRDYAGQGLSRAEKNLSVAEREILAARVVLLTQYRRASKVLQESVTAAEMEKRHQNVEALFDRGIITSSLVIEAHRQMVDFTASRNGHELMALEALWKVYALDGRLLPLLEEGAL